jgi:hypothetical protein
MFLKTENVPVLTWIKVCDSHIMLVEVRAIQANLHVNKI